MTLWGLLSYVPGLPPYRTYRGCVKYLDDIAAHLELRHPELKGELIPPPIRRDADICRFAIETFNAVLEAVEGVHRGLDLDECEAIFDEHRPLYERIR